MLCLARADSDGASEEDADIAQEAEAASEAVDLLGDLRIEPANDAERAAKFALYETLADTTGQVRRDLLSHWDECKTLFEGNAAAAMDREIKRIDREDNLGIADEGQESCWFVYSMAAKTQANASMMNGIVRDIDRKLALLGQQSECPVCLEDFDAATRRAHVLGCCHKVCIECWEHWQEENHGHGYCPLCRNDDFLGVMFQYSPE